MYGNWKQEFNIISRQNNPMMWKPAGGRSRVTERQGILGEKNERYWRDYDQKRGLSEDDALGISYA